MHNINVDLSTQRCMHIYIHVKDVLRDVLTLTIDTYSHMGDKRHYTIRHLYVVLVSLKQHTDV